MSKQDLYALARLHDLSDEQLDMLDQLEVQLREHWGLGQNIVLCWCMVKNGVMLLMVPHYFLGQFDISARDSSTVERNKILHTKFIRRLIASERRMEAEEFRSTARRFKIEPEFIHLSNSCGMGSSVLAAIDTLIKRYSISYVDSRAVLLFDIVDFSLFSPFEQTSQLNSLSYSLNSAYYKMLRRNIQIDFARTTTGDGFYIWNRSQDDMASSHLFQFMLLVIMDNAIAKRKSRGNTVPLIRTGFHIGSHYEFYQAEALNPGLQSYIVGDVTIELARMLENAEPGQIYIGDFHTQIPTSAREGAYLIWVKTPQFVERASRQLADNPSCTEQLSCYVTGENGASGGETAKRFLITDKHGFSRYAYNLRINIYRRYHDPIILGMQGQRSARMKSDLRKVAHKRSMATSRQPDLVGS